MTDDEKKQVPPPVETPRDGIHAPGGYSHIDERDLRMRQETRWLRLEADIEAMTPVVVTTEARTIRMETKLDVALDLLRPRPPIHWSVQSAIAFAAAIASIALIMIAFCVFTFVHSPVARASVPLVETARR